MDEGPAGRYVARASFLLESGTHGGICNMAVPMHLTLNLGGEAEEPKVINQQPDWVTSPPHWVQVSHHLAPLIAGGEPFLFCRNTDLPFPDGSVGMIISNNVPVDINTWLGPGVQSSEVHRVLRSGGQWRHNGQIVYTKP